MQIVSANRFVPSIHRDPSSRRGEIGAQEAESYIGLLTRTDVVWPMRRHPAHKNRYSQFGYIVPYHAASSVCHLHAASRFLAVPMLMRRDAVVNCQKNGLYFT
jgi:hypothetical protein